MTALIGEILACLIVATGIGIVVGWLLRHLSVRTLTQHIYDVTTALQQKEQALHQIQLELKAKASTIQIYESRLTSSDAQLRDAQGELAARLEQLTAVQRELAAGVQRISVLESEYSASLQRFQESDARIRTFEQQAREAGAACTAAQQELQLKEEALRELQAQLGGMENCAAEAARMKALVAELEPAQGRVHWLEVQLSEKEVQHRAALHEMELEHGALARRIVELEGLQQEVQRRTETAQEWESKHNKMLKQQSSDALQLEKYRTMIQEIQSTLAERDRSLNVKESQLAAVQRQLDELRVLQSEMGKREEEISRLRKRLVEARASLRVRGDGATVTSSRVGKEDRQLSLEIGRSKPQNELRKDDLKKIRGISPGVEKALNKMGTYTYVQIAKWSSADIARVAEQLDTAPERIKRDNWIASAKKQHREKYGEEP